jgi:hypothetical protein
MTEGLDIDAIAAMAMDFPDVTEGTRWGNRTWSVAGKAFVWERPMTKADIKRFGDARIPSEPIVAIRVEDMHDKEAILASEPAGAFDIQHFENYPAYLIELSQTTVEAAREAITDGWLAVAPTTLARSFLSRP